MLEALVEALGKNPRKLDQVARLIEELRASDEGRALLPEEFERIWEPLWEARKELGRHGR